MNKETFLQELERQLQILEDQEQQDILEEYAQHIDIKIQKGLSEEEAIQDFGPVKELAAGILEAYHVKPEYEEVKPRMKAPDLTKVTAEGKKVCGSVGGFLKQKLMAFGRWIRNSCRWIGEKAKTFGCWLAKPFRKKKGEDKVEIVRQQEEKTKVLPAAVRGVGSLWNGFLVLCKGCIRLTWNLFWLGMTVFTGIFTLLALFSFGMLLVLVLQGYPLAGWVILSLGFILCGGALTAGCYSLIRRKCKDAVVMTEPEMEEVQYE